MSFSSFISRRVSEFSGLFLVTLGTFLAIAFLTFDPLDPSANLAADVPVKNMAGSLGAYIAVPVLQFIGLSALAVVLAPLAWGYRLLLKLDTIKVLWPRFGLVMFTIPPLAAAASLIDQIRALPDIWPASSYGGIIGNYLSQELIPLIGLPVFAITSCLLAVCLLIASMGLSLEQWSGIARLISRFLKAIAELIRVGVKAIAIIFKTRPHIAEVTHESKKDVPALKKRRIVKADRKQMRITEQAKQESLDLFLPDRFQLPSLNFLKAPSGRNKSVVTESNLSNNAELLEKVLQDFGITGEIAEVLPGPVVTLYVLEPSAGTRSSRVIGLADDIARSMSAVSARISAIPGRNAIGIELPNSSRETVFLRELLEADEYKDNKMLLPLVLGKDIGGTPIFADLAKMPHLLIAGTTGSGKSVGLNGMILSLLYRYTPAECKFIMIDPKMLELSVYDGIPHLLAPVVTESKKAIVALKWATREMENRYRLMSQLGVRNILGYNQRIAEAAEANENLSRTVQTGFDPDTGKPIMETIPLETTPLPYIVVIVDEMADLMIVSGKEVEAYIQRLAQMARAAGIHIMMATQRPSVDVITGVIKANFPTRISYQVTSRIDSRTILGEHGAEQLLGMGDMLYMAGGGRISRVHGPFVDDKEIQKVADFLRKQGSPAYVEDVTKVEDEDGEETFGMESGGETDELYDKAVAIVLRDQKASTSYVQRVLKIGYNRAASIIERMEKEGLVSPANHVGKREILVEHQN